MNIQSICYSTSRYATTNPPISEGYELALTVQQGGFPPTVTGILLTQSTFYNDDKTFQSAMLTPAQFDELTALFESLGIGEWMLAKLEEPPAPPMPPMPGGSSSVGFSVTFNSATLTVSEETEAIARFVRQMKTYLQA